MAIRNIKRVLTDLVAYYTYTRQAGHTSLMRDGIDRNFGRAPIHEKRPHFVLVHSVDGARAFEGHDCVSLETLDRLRGCSRPLAIDNGAMHVMLEAALIKIQKLENEVAILREKI